MNVSQAARLTPPLTPRASPGLDISQMIRPCCRASPANSLIIARIDNGVEQVQAPAVAAVITSTFSKELQ
jgi:hypothetical protein